MRRTALALPLVALAVPATAAAQTPPPAPTPAPPATVPTPAPAPVKAKLTLGAQGTIGSAKRPAALAGRAFTARVVMRPYVAGEKAVVRVYRGKRKIQVKALRLKSVAGGSAGVATLKVSSKLTGRLTLRASHRATDVAGTAVAKATRVTVVRAYAGPGARGAAVQYLQDRLAALHYVTSTSGVYDDRTGRAILAWRKVAGLPRTTTADASAFSALASGRGVFKVRHGGDGRHVEARLNQQVLALVNGNKVERIYHTSSGAAATPTIRGRYQVYRKDPGTNAKGMVDSSYFIRGYAIHGYVSVPNYNASHGCLRVPLADARAIYDWLRLGDVVWVEP
jgi:lipoprotein-anchoring transpeptidase ErfK/SrfK